MLDIPLPLTTAGGRSKNNALNKIGWIVAAALGLFVVAALAGVVRGGPLDPPGPPAPTQPQVEPRTPVQSLPGNGAAQYVISQPGSYFLTANITGASAKDAIDIAADDVSLDLNGFAIRGVSGAVNAISDSGAAHVRWNIHGGTIDSFWSRGISASNVGDSVFSDLVINGAVMAAIQAGGAIRASNITAEANASDGLVFGPAAMLSHCFVDTSASLQGVGIDVGDQSTVDSCSTTGTFLTAILLGPASRLTGCNVRFAGNYGVYAGVGSTVRNCTIGGTNSIAIQATGNTSIAGNVVDTASYGIYVPGSANRIEDNQVEHTTYGVDIPTGVSGNLVVRNRLRDIPNPIVNGGSNQIGAVVGVNSGNPDANIAY